MGSEISSFDLYSGGPNPHKNSSTNTRTNLRTALTLSAFEDNLLKKIRDISVKKLFFLVFLFSSLLPRESFAHADKIPNDANPLGIRQDISKREEILKDFDGKKWKTLSFKQKCSLYTGYELGQIMTIERIKKLEGLLQNLYGKTVSQELQEEFKNLHDGLDIFMELLEKYDAVVALEEMVRLVDKFYENPENLNILIHQAFVINKLVKEGASPKTINNLIDSYRKKDKIAGDSVLISPWLPIP